MAKKFENTSLSTKEIASQLRKPSGKEGKEVGKEMNKGNKYICLNSYKLLNPKSNSKILEIGMGNGFFVKDLLNLSSNLKYTGLDFSQIMIDEAITLNKDLIKEGKAEFIHGSIENLPFEDNSFDYLTTTNTIYFWPDLEENAKEIYRVLNPKGKILIGYRSKELMEKIEFTKYGFSKFTTGEIGELLSTVGFKNVSSSIISEPDLDFDGKPVKMEGFYTTGIK